MEIETVKNNVKKILSKYKETRNDDGKLLDNYYNEYFINYFDERIENYNNKCSIETIIRMRRFWQSRGEYLPTLKTIMRRRRLANKFKLYFRKLK